MPTHARWGLDQRPDVVSVPIAVRPALGRRSKLAVTYAWLMFWIVVAAIVAVGCAFGLWSDWRDRRAGRTVDLGDLREARRDTRAIAANPVVNSAMGTRWMNRHGRKNDDPVPAPDDPAGS